MSKFLIPQTQGGAKEPAFLVSFQVLLTLLALKSKFEGFHCCCCCCFFAFCFCVFLTLWSICKEKRVDEQLDPEGSNLITMDDTLCLCQAFAGPTRSYLHSLVSPTALSALYLFSTAPMRMLLCSLKIWRV